MSAVVLINRGGGAVAADPKIVGKVADALKSAGVTAGVELVDGGDYEARCRAIAERGRTLLIVGGGDGTVGAAASALAGSDALLGILPLGTLNHFARDLGIPTDLDDAAALIASRSERRVDVAEMNGRTFINNSAIGLYPLMVVDRDLQRKRLGRSKRLAMLIASVRALRHFSRHRLTLRAAGLERPIQTPLLFVGNNRYETSLLTLGRRAALDQGELCLYAMLAQKTHFLAVDFALFKMLGAHAATALMGALLLADANGRLPGVESLRNIDQKQARASRASNPHPAATDE